MAHAAALVGAGGIGRTHAAALARSDRLELVALADPDATAREDVGDEHGVPESRRYTDHESLFAAERPDAVTVASPTPFHAEQTLAAMETASPAVVLCEKPVADSVADAERMVEVAAETDTDLVVNHSRRFSPAHRSLRDALADGVLGDVRAVNVHWRRELLRNGTHVVDLLGFLLGLRFETVTGHATDAHGLEAPIAVGDTGAAAVLTATDGTVVTLDCTLPREYAAQCIRLVGTEGRIEIDEHGGEWRYWDLDDGEHVERPWPGGETGYDSRSMRDGAVEHVADLLEGAAENVSPGTAGVRAVAALTAVLLSDRTGGRVSLPLAPPLRDMTVGSW
jgi:predicted dehydrogenase